MNIWGEEDQPDNKFHGGNTTDGKHYWLTPPDLYAELDAEHHFDFDPCPFPLPDDFDGLTAEWGESNYVNPPFGSIIHNGKKKGPTAWVRKALKEHQKGKRVVFVYPLPKWVLMLIEAGATVQNLGDVRWRATEDGSIGPGIGQYTACFVLEPLARSQRLNVCPNCLDRTEAVSPAMCEQCEQQNLIDRRTAGAPYFQGQKT